MLNNEILAEILKTEDFNANEKFYETLEEQGIVDKEGLLERIIPFISYGFSDNEIKTIFEKCPEFFLQTCEAFKIEFPKMVMFLGLDNVPESYKEFVSKNMFVFDYGIDSVAGTHRQLLNTNPYIFAFGLVELIKNIKILGKNNGLSENDAKYLTKLFPDIYKPDMQELEGTTEQIHINIYKKPRKKLHTAIQNNESPLIDSTYDFFSSYTHPKTNQRVFTDDVKLEAMLKKDRAKNLRRDDMSTIKHNLDTLFEFEVNTPADIIYKKPTYAGGNRLKYRYKLAKYMVGNISKKTFINKDELVTGDVDRLYAKGRLLKEFREVKFLTLNDWLMNKEEFEEFLCNPAVLEKLSHLPTETIYLPAETPDHPPIEKKRILYLLHKDYMIGFKEYQEIENIDISNELIR